MTSLEQIVANRRNARNSSGPITQEGKDRSRCNAVRHGLTAETVISEFEDAEDYKAFEAAVIADYDAQSAIAQELVLRLASLFWRLRRASAIETDLFEMMADNCCRFRRANQIQPRTPATSETDHSVDRGTELGRSFLRLVNLPNSILDGLSRYEVNLWRQANQILFALDTLDRRKPQERRSLSECAKDEKIAVLCARKILTAIVLSVAKAVL
jgi:hypothetical protein